MSAGEEQRQPRTMSAVAVVFDYLCSGTQGVGFGVGA